jgi:hypothetical protein
MAKSQLRTYVFTPGTVPNGKILIPGKFDLNQILIITNTTTNAILYNFADVAYTGTQVSFSRANDLTNFPNALDNTDGITTITLAVSTVGQNSADALQILYERPEMLVRMPEIGTDAFERTRVATPQSMLDADFEYGLQPTKWLTYDLMRGYPSVYEIPGTDQSILSVTTDASVGTGGVGESLITIVNSVPWAASWIVGTAFTVKGYLNTVSGFARAEGSFIINSVSGSTLTYYAKAKVGTNNGEILSSTYTQVRQGNFYTGSNVGFPTLTYTTPATVGSSSSATIATASTTFTGTISSGSTTLTTVNSPGTPTVGQILSGGNIVTGTYIISGSGTTWTVSTPQITTTSGATLTAVTNTLTAAGTSSGLAVGQVISGTGIITGTTILAANISPFTGSGGNGTYAVNVAQTVGSGVAVVGTTALSTVTATFQTPHGFVPGDTIINIVASDTGNTSGHSLVQGPFFAETVPTATSLTFSARASGIIANSTLSTFVITDTTGGITVSNTTLYTAQPVFISGTNSGSGSITSGTYYVQTGGTGTAFRLLIAPNGATATTTAGTPSGLTVVAGISVAIYARPDAFYSHRPFDGGVILGTGGPAHGSMAVRMSKKYIRYQSGKAINYNTGALFAPNYDIRSITASGTTITITTDDVDHGCQAGATVIISGVNDTTPGYNGTYTVASIVDERTLTVIAGSAPATSPASIGSPCLLSVSGWWGATVRAGTFDEQNGMFWQWDGQRLALGRRSSTFQVAGSVSIVPDSNTVTGTNTRFTSQLISGDRVVIRGMTHVITQVLSDTTIYVTPDYRGSTSASGVKIVKIIDRIVPQNQWNVDRCDGTNGVYNPSGYTININRMQMIGLQWTWYGAGFIDWMIRGPQGNFITVHRLRGNNLNNEAFMRSGNQPVRYEVVNEAARTSLTADPGSGGTTLSVQDVTYFPTPGATYPGYLWSDGELISYTGRTVGATTQNYLGQSLTAGTLTGCVRAASMTQFVAGANRTFTGGAAASHAIGSGVILIGQTATPSISHWGSAFLQDGRFDEDRGYIFNYQATNVTINTKKTTAFAIRLAPSVSNAIVGDLGVRELINRAQLLLQQIEITAGGTTNSNSALVVEAILNPSNYPADVTKISWNSLNSTALQTGQPSFSQIALGTSVTFQGSATNLASNTLSAYQNTSYSGFTVLPVNQTTGILIGDDVFVPAAPAAIYGATKITTIYNNQAFAGTLPATVTAGTTASALTSTIAGTLFTIGGTVTGTFITGMVLTGGSIPANVYIIGPGVLANTWYINTSVTQASATITGTPYVMNVTAVSSGVVLPSQILTGGTVTASTQIIGYLTGTGGTGTYYLNQGYTGSPTGASSGVNALVFNNPVPTPWFAGTSTQFSRNTYALPGETVFSFISSPSNKDSLDLTPFKELTNTPIGGRGTFPNGPDVLFINVYLTQGAPVLANLTLRWGEAQA